MILEARSIIPPLRQGSKIAHHYFRSDSCGDSRFGGYENVSSGHRVDHSVRFGVVGVRFEAATTARHLGPRRSRLLPQAIQSQRFQRWTAIPIVRRSFRSGFVGAGRRRFPTYWTSVRWRHRQVLLQGKRLLFFACLHRRYCIVSRAILKSPQWRKA